MSDEPRVEVVKDDNEKEQWGKKLFFSQDGQKSSLNTRRVFLSLAGFFVIFTVVQLLNTTPAASDTNSNVGAPGSIEPSQLVEIPSNKDIELPPPTKSKRGGSGKGGIKYTGPQLVARPINLASIPPGSMVGATLLSGASNGLVRAELANSLLVNGTTILPTGAVLVGQGSSTEERLQVTFNQVVFRDGTFGSINAQACDASDKIVGLKGSKLGNTALNLTGAIGLGFVGGLSQGLQDTQGQYGAVVTPPSMKNALLNGTSAAAMEQSQNLMQDLKNRQPIIEVPSGTKICVMFAGGQ
jgi:hypothetical protein